MASIRQFKVGDKFREKKTIFTITGPVTPGGMFPLWNVRIDFRDSTVDGTLSERDIIRFMKEGRLTHINPTGLLNFKRKD